MLPVLKALCFCMAFLCLSGASALAQCVSPAGTPGEMIYNTSQSVFQGCTPTGWKAFHGAAYVLNCPGVGDSCDNGTIYAGLSPDGNVPMYATATDAPGTYTWNNGSTNWHNTAMVSCFDPSGVQLSCRTGRSNTTLLAGLVDISAPYVAAKYCDDLTLGGFSDWYLPAQNELEILYALHTQIPPKGGFAAALYWSSSENSADDARAINFTDGSYVNQQRDGARRVRCVRR